MRLAARVIRRAGSVLWHKWRVAALLTCRHAWLHVMRMLGSRKGGGFSRQRLCNTCAGLSASAPWFSTSIGAPPHARSDKLAPGCVHMRHFQHLGVPCMCKARTQCCMEQNRASGTQATLTRPCSFLAARSSASAAGSSALAELFITVHLGKHDCQASTSTCASNSACAAAAVGCLLCHKLPCLKVSTFAKQGLRAQPRDSHSACTSLSEAA